MSYPQPTDRLPGESANVPVGYPDERTALAAFLQRQRELVVWKVTGLPADALQDPSTPSGMTALGIVRHLSMVERIWFRDRVAHETDLRLVRSEQDWDEQFRIADGTTVEQVVADYAAECEAADRAIAGIPLDPVAAAQPSLRWVYLHMIEETARHLGHLDLLRERADGMTGEEPVPW